MRLFAACSRILATNGTMAISFPSRRPVKIRSRKSRSRVWMGMFFGSVMSPQPRREVFEEAALAGVRSDGL